jgi:hypothetical protein
VDHARRQQEEHPQRVHPPLVGNAEIAKVRISLPTEPGPAAGSATDRATRIQTLGGTPANDTGNENYSLTSRA